MSGLNACAYCHGVHRQTARAFGVEESRIERLLNDLDAAPAEPKLHPLLADARKPTLGPSTMVQADAQAVLETGWSERDLHDAVLTIGLFSLVNRLLEGHGVQGQDHVYKDRGAALARDGDAPPLAHLPASPPA